MKTNTCFSSTDARTVHRLLSHERESIRNLRTVRSRSLSKVIATSISGQKHLWLRIHFGEIQQSWNATLVIHSGDWYPGCWQVKNSCE